MNAGRGVEKREPSCTVGGNVNWYSHYGEQYGGSLKKLKIELPYDQAIPLLGIYRENMKTEKDKYHMISLIWNLKNDTNETYLQNRNRLTDIENQLCLPKGKGREE